MIMKKKGSAFFIVTLAVVLALSVCYYFMIFNSVRDGYVSIHGDYKGYSSADELYSDAELIVIGKPTEEFEERESYVKHYESGAIGDFYTLTKIQVEKTLKGPVELTDLKVIEPVVLDQTIAGKQRISIENYTEMKLGSEYLIFLKKNTNGQFGVINMQSGKFNLDGSDPNDFYLNNETETESSIILQEIKSNKERLFVDIQEKYLK